MHHTGNQVRHKAHFLLMNKMSQVRQGRLNTLDIATQEDEVGHLVSSYNYMINSVKELMDNQYRLGQEKKEPSSRRCSPRSIRIFCTTRSI